MPKITFLPHALCPKGKTVEAPAGASILEIALQNGIDIEHACEMSCACTTCHVLVTQGGQSLTAASETEEDLLDKAWGLTLQSRLGCQARVTNADLEVEIPLYTINHTRE